MNWLLHNSIAFRDTGVEKVIKLFLICIQAKSTLAEILGGAIRSIILFHSTFPIVGITHRQVGKKLSYKSSPEMGCLKVE